jgi:hypothetical protein
VTATRRVPIRHRSGFDDVVLGLVRAEALAVDAGRIIGEVMREDRHVVTAPILRIHPRGYRAGGGGDGGDAAAQPVSSGCGMTPTSTTLRART